MVLNENQFYRTAHSLEKSLQESIFREDLSLYNSSLAGGGGAVHGAPVQLDVGVAHGPEIAVGAFELLQR